MSNEHDPIGQWERVALELRACKESQRKAWGDIDNATLGRYLAGEVSADERAHVEGALEELPELRRLTDLVRDVLCGLQADVSEPAAPPVAERPAPRPAVQRFPAPAPRRRRFVPFLQRRGPLVAAACLVLTFGLLMPTPGYLSAPRPEGQFPAGEDMASTRPLPRTGAPQPLRLAAGVVNREVALHPEPPPAAPRPADGAKLALARNGSQNQAGRSSYVVARHVAVRARWGQYYRSQGDLIRAVPELAVAHNLCQQQVGPDHPATRQAVRQLAGVYQVALNCEDMATSTRGSTVRPRGFEPQPVPSPAPVPPPPPSQVSAWQLRDQITRRPVAEVQRSIVPVLAEALRLAGTESERRALVTALGKLGPAARAALPALTARLQKSNDPEEVGAILHTLQEMGPAARPALVVLNQLTAQPAAFAAPPPQPGSMRADGRQPVGKLAQREKELCHEVVRRLAGREGRVGVTDPTGCFSVRLLRNSMLELRELARRADVEVLIETVLPGREPANRLARMGPKAVHIRIDPASPAVEVRASEAITAAGFNAERLRQQVLRHLRQRHYDDALREGVQFVQRMQRETPED